VKKFIILLSLAVLFSHIANSAENMSFHGTLVEPPCTISEGKTIEVAFGNSLGINKIDGNNYKEPVNYTVNCDAGYTAHNLAIIIDTTVPASFDKSAVTTDKEGLGIRILIDGVPATFARRIEVINPSSPPKIEAVPVQDQSVTLTEGGFEATVTLRADYI